MIRAILTPKQQRQRKRGNREVLQRRTYGFVPAPPPQFALPDDAGWPLNVAMQAAYQRDPKAPVVVAYRQLQSLGYDKPECEWPFFGGRRWAFDFAWPDKHIALEIEGFGGRHQTVAGMTGDAEKYSIAAILGWVVLRATTKMVTDGSMLALVELAMGSYRNVNFEQADA